MPEAQKLVNTESERLKFQPVPPPKAPDAPKAHPALRVALSQGGSGQKSGLLVLSLVLEKQLR